MDHLGCRNGHRCNTPETVDVHRFVSLSYLLNVCTASDLVGACHLWKIDLGRQSRKVVRVVAFSPNLVITLVLGFDTPQWSERSHPLNVVRELIALVYILPGNLYTPGSNLSESPFLYPNFGQSLGVISFGSSTTRECIHMVADLPAVRLCHIQQIL